MPDLPSIPWARYGAVPRPWSTLPLSTTMAIWPKVFMILCRFGRGRLTPTTRLTLFTAILTLLIPLLDLENWSRQVSLASRYSPLISALLAPKVVP